jgi:hypothetical protein
LDGPDAAAGFVGEVLLIGAVLLALVEDGEVAPCFSASFLSICSRSSLFLRSENSDVSKSEIENKKDI